MKRLFIALPLQEITKNEIFHGMFSAEPIKNMPVRWTSLQNLHLTLQFLGDVDEKRIPVLKQIINRLGTSGIQDSLVFTNIGAFPSVSAPRVIWLGIKQNDLLRKMQKRLTFDLILNEFTADQKKFKPHLTLGRVKENANVSAGMISSLEGIRANLTITPSPLDRIILFESRLKPGGPEYSALYEKKFS